MKNYIVIVSCYGLFHESRSQKELDGLDSYVRDLSKYINALDEKPYAIVLCGGRTAPEVSAQSEAESMLEYILEKELLPDQHLLVETTSHSTPENLVFGLASVRLILDHSATILCICDTPRFEKVSVESNILFGDYFDIEVKAFDRMDSNEKSKREYQTFVALPEELKAKKFEFLKEYIQEVVIDSSFSGGAETDITE
jgi:hypothetical protein